MPTPIAVCPEDGLVAGETCPVCERDLDALLSGERRRRLSKYLSGALRHFPDDTGLDLDDAGWTDFDELVGAAEVQYDWADAETVAAVIVTDPNGRFERAGDRVRAAYGHSVAVNLESGGTPVPATLYHGTAPRNLDSIMAEGLRPMARQHVHLSGTLEAAEDVGSRHADDPVILEVDAAGMLAAEYEITKRGREVYTTDRVPPDYVRER